MSRRRQSTEDSRKKIRPRGGKGQTRKLAVMAPHETVRNTRRREPPTERQLHALVEHSRR
jgi:hypothetical protein